MSKANEAAAELQGEGNLSRIHFEISSGGASPSLKLLSEANEDVSPSFRGREILFEFTSKRIGKGKPFPSY